jgi:hypothetical protein
MNDELLEIQSQILLREGIKADLRGGGKAVFLYVRSLERAAEVSLEGKDFFVELWDNADEESEKAPVRSELVQRVSSVIQILGQWL